MLWGRCVGTFVRLVRLLRGRALGIRRGLRVLLLLGGRGSYFERRCVVLLDNGGRARVSIVVGRGKSDT